MIHSKNMAILLVKRTKKDFGGAKVIGSGKNQSMWNSLKIFIDLNNFACVTHD